MASVSTFGVRGMIAMATAPAVVVFLSSNLVNVGNLAFNMIFSRLMGPELFGTLALLLTIKLALLGITGAIQMAVSQMVASCNQEERPAVEQALSRINRLLFLGVCILGSSLTASFMLDGTVGARLSPTEPHLLALLLISMPFGASLSVLRGVAFGDMKTGRIVLSANVEMAVRLVGALIAWALGFGIEGVVIAISLSIFAGWAVLYDLLPVSESGTKIEGYSKILGLAAIPFAILQLTQVIALDGDIFIAKALFSDSEVGFVGALSLFQRIQFFACFALAGVLLPRVVKAAQAGDNILMAALPVFIIFAAASVVALSAALVAPEVLIKILVGSAYLPAATVLHITVIAAIFFTFNYLVVTVMIAVRDNLGIALIATGVAVQFAFMALSDPSGFAELVAIKAVCQAFIAVTLVFRVFPRNSLSASLYSTK